MLGTSRIVALVIAAVLAGCGGATTGEASVAPTEAASATPTPEPTPTPTIEPTPTPTLEPTADPAAFGEMYIALTEELNVSQCEFIDMINADFENPVVWQEGVEGLGQAWAAMAEGLRQADVPAVVEADVAALLVGIGALVASSQEIAAAPADMNIIRPLYETEFATIQLEQIAPAADAIRSELGLPPRPENPCG